MRVASMENGTSENVNNVYSFSEPLIPQHASIEKTSRAKAMYWSAAAAAAVVVQKVQASHQCSVVDGKVTGQKASASRDGSSTPRRITADRKHDNNKTKEMKMLHAAALEGM